MSFFTQTISIPIWLFLVMLLAILPLTIKLFGLLYQFRRGEIEKEELDDMVVWKIRNQRRSAIPKKILADPQTLKQQAEKQDLIQVLKVLLKEGDKGVRLQTVADKLRLDLPKVQQALATLVQRKMVEEVVGLSGTRYYLTQAGSEYCRRKARV